MNQREKSKEYYKQAIEVIPGGVNSPVRSFGGVHLTPIFAKEAKGARLIDVDEQTYIDYICSWGPLILGHASDVTMTGVVEVLKGGTTFGLPTQIETEMAKLIIKALPSIEMVRMVNSGTEATMSALRLARAYTKKDKIIKFEGCYHGHSDGLLVKSGSGTLTEGIPTSEGISQTVIQDTLVATFNDIESVKKLVEEHKNQIAAVLIEPIPGNMGLIVEKDNFLYKLRELTEEEGIILIFDEVISGFRIGYGGAQELYGIEADLTCLGKIIGGGLPVGAYGGKKEIMSMVAPSGNVYQAGTLSGNPLALRMGYNTLEFLKVHPEVYIHLDRLAGKLEIGFNKNIKALGMQDVTVNRLGGMVCQFFARAPIDSYEKVMTSDTNKYAVYFKVMLEQGILLPPAQYECMFLSYAHTDEDIEETLKCHFKAMKKVCEL